MKPLCVIPSKSISKRFPNKNITSLCGKPMLYWTIEACLESNIFDSVFVSTDSEDIANIARHYGATVPYLRPVELTGDTVTNVDVSIHLYDFLSEEHGRKYDAIFCLQPTSPLRTSSSIANAWALFEREQHDFLVSVTSIDPHYFHWALEKKADDNYQMFFGDRFMTVRQDLPPVYRPNGAIKIAKPDSLKERHNFFGTNLGVYSMPEKESIHVAHESDLLMAQTFMRDIVKNG